MNDREFIAVFHYDNGGTNRCGAEPYRYAEEIVRCKECRRWATKYFEDGYGWCEHHINETTADDFCSYGEAKGK